jgi:hypothetical protein
MPFRQFLARVQSLISNKDVKHAYAIAYDLKIEALRQKGRQVTDGKRAAPIIEFTSARLVRAVRAVLNRRFNPGNNASSGSKYADLVDHLLHMS